MIRRRRKALSLSLIMGFFVVFNACDEDEQVFDAPTIAVTVDNSQPYPGDEINVNISVSGSGGLKEISLNGTVIKSYTGTATVTNDAFDFAYEVPANSSLGPVALEFVVTDLQSSPKSGSFTSSLTIQNPDFRGEPSVLFDFQSAIPNNKVKEITRDSGPNSWENAYTLTFDVADPISPANKVLQADRKGAHEWYFQGGGAIKIEFANFISEDDIQKLVSGERVLQMNMYFKELPKLVTLHKDPTNPDGSTKQNNVDLSWKLSSTNEPLPPATLPNKKGWQFELNDSLVAAIPVLIELGNKAAWAWNDGDVRGKKFYLVGSITKANEWQTVTFTRLTGTFSRDETKTGSAKWVRTNIRPAVQTSTASAALQDAAVGLDQINYFSIIVNSRITSFKNKNGWYEMPGDGNGWNANVVASLSDDHNSYFIDNIRTIKAADFDKNPNN
jgi:hypothetical protein